MVADPFQVGDYVGGQQHGQFAVGDGIDQGLHELAAGERGEAGHRFVQHQHPWSFGHREGEATFPVRILACGVGESVHTGP